MPERVPDPTLPPGWEQLYDAATNSRYYWDRNTNTTTYTKPPGGPAPAPAPQVSESSLCLRKLDSIDLSSIFFELLLPLCRPTVMQGPMLEAMLPPTVLLQHTRIHLAVRATACQRKNIALNTT